MTVLKFLDETMDNANEEGIRKRLRQMKEDKTSFLLKIKKNYMFSLDTKSKCDLVPFVKITKIADSCLEGVGRDSSLGQTIIEITGSEPDGKSINIHFKLAGQEMENIVNIVDSFRRVFKDDQELKLLLNNTQTKGEESRTALILPAMMATYNYLLQNKTLTHAKFVGMLDEAGVDWLSFVFNGLDLEEQGLLFSRENKEVDNLVQYIFRGEEAMLREREDFLTMMINLDKKESKDQENGPRRIIERLKRSLESSSQLSNWIDAVDAKYPMPRNKMIFRNIISFFTVIVGVGMVVTDVGTDGSFTENMTELQREAMANETQSNCTEKYHETLDNIPNSCPHTSSDSFDCLRNLEAAVVGWQSCFNKEVNRFEEASMWGMMYKVSISHMVIPWVLSLICGVILWRRTNNWCKILEFIPVVAKLKMFYYDLQLNQRKTMEKSVENDEYIKNLKKKNEELEESVTLVIISKSVTSAALNILYLYYTEAKSSIFI